MSHKLGICIPYRNREEHLKKLIPHLTEHLNRQGIEHTFYVGHQVDDKLFNRGAMKNIAAKTAFEDGCDYVAWHDVDMLPQSDADYSYPMEYPIHIATKLSKYEYGMGYDQYFGGVVLFTKEQVERTNGYSNDYWDWGMEDDDLFWRCYFEGMSTGNIFRKYENKKVGVFNGEKSFVEIPSNRKMVECLNKNHTLSILVNSEQQVDKVPIWLIGDKNK
jgi:predicted glycosyltransferase involved in capsule biosynthesis